MRTRRRRGVPPQWVQLGAGSDRYNRGSPPYQEGGLWSALAGPVMSMLGQNALAVGKEAACKAARTFRQKHCKRFRHEEDEEEEYRKTKKVQNTKRGCALFGESPRSCFNETMGKRW